MYISSSEETTTWWKRLHHRRVNRWSLRALYILLFITITADFWANEKPIYCQIDGNTYWPIFYSYARPLGIVAPNGKLEQINWLTESYDRVIRCPIPYSPTTIDRKNMRAIGPGGNQRFASLRFRHWLGTDELGKDVAAGLIHGTRIALMVGLVAMLFASIIGISLGAIAGYYGDTRLSWPRQRFGVLILGSLPWWFYGWIAPVPWGLEQTFLTRLLWIIFTLVVLLLVSRVLVPRRPNQIMTAWPLDFCIMRIIEMLNAIPALLLLLAIVATLEKSSLFLVMAIIGVIRWTGIARFVRAEMLKIRDQHYIEAGRVIGLKENQILWRHALPNGLRPVLITIAFGISGAILLEAFLYFLGIGLPPDMVTWGTMLNIIKSTPNAWWVAVCPGMAIFVTVTIFNILGEGLTEALGK